MRVGTGIKCNICKTEIMQDMGGNLYCKCGKKTKWGFIAVGNGKQ